MSSNKKVGNEDKKLKELNKAHRKSILDSICDIIETAKHERDNKKLPNGFVKNIVDKMSKDNPWLTRNVINHAYSDRTKSKNIRVPKCPPDQFSQMSPLSGEDIVTSGSNYTSSSGSEKYSSFSETQTSNESSDDSKRNS